MLRRPIDLPIAADAALPATAFAALSAGEAETAYFAADRWLRLSGANRGNLLARAEAAMRLGRNDLALEDARRGLRLDPRDLEFARRMALWGGSEERVAASRALTRGARQDAATARKILAQAGETGAGHLRVEGGEAVGWAAWRPQEAAELLIDGDESATIRLRPDPDCGFADAFGAACAFRLRVDVAHPRRIALAVGGRAVAEERLPARAQIDAPGRAAGLTVIVPVYGDLAATRACLETVAAEVAATPGAEALAIDDGSPDGGIKTCLAEFAARSGCRTATLPANFGFVAAVNAGLRSLSGGDALILNADTLLPEGALARLMAAARGRAVGIVNPLSNHGEFTSFPKPFARNALPETEWRAIDRAAAALREAPLVDIPSATGFCLYVTRACLDAVGELSPAFGEGYLEDADFGLRAREAGFRNVCAPSVYVPHWGSRSFQGAKAALVARNQRTLARRFPDYEAECEAFLAADPLGPARARLERATAAAHAPRRMLLGPARWAAALSERAERHFAEGRESIIALYERHGDALRLRLRGRGDAAPQNGVVGPTRDPGDLARALAEWPRDGLEYFAEAEEPTALFDALARDRAPRVVILAHAGPPPQAQRVVAFDAMAARACETRGLPVRRAGRPPGPPARRPDGSELAILYPFETSASFATLEALARALAARGRTAVLIGASRADAWLIAQGLLATGPAAFEDWPRLLAVHAPRRFALPYRSEGFWALERARALSPAPAAYFDFTRTGFVARKGDLSLNPDVGDDDATAAWLDWAPRQASALT